MSESNVCMAFRKENLKLSEYSSMKTGGTVKYAYFPGDTTQLAECICELEGSGLKYFVIGNASNVLFPDGFIDGAVVFTTEMKKFSVIDECDFEMYGISCDDTCSYIYAQSGASFTALALFAAKNGLSGLEFAYGIPGTVGGAVYMNAGAYGGETKDVLYISEALTTDGEIVRFNNAESLLSYRHSVFCDRRDLAIVGAVFKLKKGNCDEILALSHENMNKRREKQPLDLPSCGSAFKRPEGHFAGALIEGAGLKGFSVGGAKVSEKHAGFIVNYNSATSEDVLNLIGQIQDIVYKKYGVMLEPEIKILEF